MQYHMGVLRGAPFLVSRAVPLRGVARGLCGGCRVVRGCAGVAHGCESVRNPKRIANPFESTSLAKSDMRPF